MTSACHIQFRAFCKPDLIDQECYIIRKYEFGEIVRIYELGKQECVILFTSRVPIIQNGRNLLNNNIAFKEENMKKNIEDFWKTRFSYRPILQTQITNDFLKNGSYLYDCLFRNHLMRNISEMFVYSLLINEGIFAIAEKKSMPASKATAKQKQKFKRDVNLFNKMRSFWLILSRLPLELQMILINRKFGCTRNTILTVWIDNALTILAHGGFFD